MSNKSFLNNTNQNTKSTTNQKRMNPLQKNLNNNTLLLSLDDTNYTRYSKESLPLADITNSTTYGSSSNFLLFGETFANKDFFNQNKNKHQAHQKTVDQLILTNHISKEESKFPNECSVSGSVYCRVLINHAF